MTFYERLKNLCKEKNVKITPLMAELGISKTALDKWRKEICFPGWENVNKLADYFGCSADYIMCRSDIRNNTKLSPTLATETAEVINADGKPFELPKHLLNGLAPDNFIVIAVSDDTAFPQYQEGDKILTLKAPEVTSGTVAVITHNNKFAIRRIYFNSDKVTAESINPNYPPMVMDISELKIIGTPVYVFRKVSDYGNL